MMILALMVFISAQQLPCFEGCSNCLNGECFECLHGWTFNSQIDNQCEYEVPKKDNYGQTKQVLFGNTQRQGICGDQIIQDNEECDDGNMNPFDGCHNCHLSCVEECQICIQGICLSCHIGWKYQTINNSCIKDQFQTQIQIFNSQIKQFCQQYLCLECIQDVCLRCQDYYYLNTFTNTCDSYCGDSIINGIESCDDGNNDIYDGCHQCQIVNYQKCDERCAFCYYGECLNCNKGYSLQNNECVSICGDNLINKDIVLDKQVEQCDNPDSQGCIDCIIQQSYLCVEQDYSICWSCDEKCTQCIKLNGKLECLECEKGYYPKGILCYDCDSNCITCHSEKYLCTSCYRDDCEYCEKTDGLYTDSHIGKCISMCGDGYLVKYYEACDDGNTDNGDGCDSDCKIESFDDESATLAPQIIETPQNYTTSQQNQMDIITNAYSSFSYLILAMAPASIILGVFQYFWQVLELLSWINNFYFLNVQYPYNVEYLFSKFDWSSLINIPTYQQLNQPDCEYYFASPKKFMNRGIDPLFINNAQVPFFFISFSLLIYFLSFIIMKAFQKLDKMSQTSIKIQKPFKLFKLAHQSNTISQQTVQDEEKQDTQIIRNVRIVKLLQLSYTLTKSLKNRVKQTVSLCLLDITMAVVLQLLFATEFQYTVVLVNEILALFACSLVIYQLLQFYNLINTHPELADYPPFQMKYGSYYQGLNTDNQFGYHYNLIYYMRKVLYQFASVFCYDNPIVQTTLCFFTFATGVILLLYCNPYDSKRQFISQFIQETSVSIILLTSTLFAYNDSAHVLSEQTIVIFGWILIAFIIVSLSLEILSLIFEIIVSLYKLLRIFYQQVKQQRQTRNAKIKEINMNQALEQQSQMSKILTVNQTNQ